MKRKLFSILLAASVAGVSPFITAGKASAVVATGNINVSVTVPPVIIVHYFSSQTIVFPETAINRFEGAASDWSSTFAATASISGGSDITAVTPTNTFLDSSSNVVSVTLPKVWAVRGWSTNGNATVAVTIGTAAISGPGSSSITMGSAEVGFGTSHGASLTTIPLNGLSWGTASSGDLRFTLDFTGTKRAGTHTGGVITLTATSV
jgi:hypothetical protein